MATTNQTFKITGLILIVVLMITIYQWYPRHAFNKYTGFKIPAASVAIKWDSDLDYFFCAFLTTPNAAKKFIERPFFGKEWRNDTLDVKLSPTHGNVPFFDLMGYELTNPDKERWFYTNIRKLDPRRYLHRGYAVIVYPNKGLIYITAGD